MNFATFSKDVTVTYKLSISYVPSMTCSKANLKNSGYQIFCVVLLISSLPAQYSQLTLHFSTRHYITFTVDTPALDKWINNSSTCFLKQEVS